MPTPLNEALQTCHLSTRNAKRMTHHDVCTTSSGLIAIAIVLLDPMVQVLKLADKEVENRTTRQRRTAVAKCFV